MKRLVVVASLTKLTHDDLVRRHDAHRFFAESSGYPVTPLDDLLRRWTDKWALTWNCAISIREAIRRTDDGATHLDPVASRIGPAFVALVEMPLGAPGRKRERQHSAELGLTILHPARACNDRRYTAAKGER